MEEELMRNLHLMIVNFHRMTMLKNLNAPQIIIDGELRMFKEKVETLVSFLKQIKEEQKTSTIQRQKMMAPCYACSKGYYETDESTVLLCKEKHTMNDQMFYERSKIGCIDFEKDNLSMEIDIAQIEADWDKWTVEDLLKEIVK